MKKKNFLRYGAWLRLAPLVLTDVFFLFLLWLAVPERLGILSLALLLFTGLVFGCAAIIEHRRAKRIRLSVLSFLEDPGEATAERVLELVDPAWQRVFRQANERLDQSVRLASEQEDELTNYRSFIEAWAHEIKTPLTLFTLILDNHGDTLTPHVRDRMEYVRHEIGADVDRVLYYARLMAGHADQMYTTVPLDELVETVYAEFHPICEERGIRVTRDLKDLTVVTDRKVLAFMLAQLLSNAIKYAAPNDGQILVTARRDATAQTVRLTVRDNGAGAAVQDLPFLFDKGFTGSRPGRQNATGMGLYFVRRFAESLSVTYGVEPDSAEGRGFGIYLEFPEVDCSDVPKTVDGAVNG